MGMEAGRGDDVAVCDDASIRRVARGDGSSWCSSTVQLLLVHVVMEVVVAVPNEGTERKGIVLVMSNTAFCDPFKESWLGFLVGVLPPFLRSGVDPPRLSHLEEEEK